jgi:tol-pal system protein YbgF
MGAALDLFMTRTLAVAAILAVFTPALASAQNREHQQMFADLRMLQEETQQLRLTVNTLAEAVKDLAKTTSSRLDDQANATRKGFADQKLLIEGVVDTSRVLREKMDDTNVRISSVAHDLESLRQTIVTLQASVAQSIAAAQAAQLALPAGAASDPTNPAGVGTPIPTTTPAAPSAAPPITGLSPDRMYSTAFSDYMTGQWELAIQGFQGYLRSFPNSPDAAKAQYFIGDAYTAAGKQKEAIAAYSVVITNYKGSSSESDAYYKRGLAYEATQQKDRAKADFEYVIKNLPDSNVAPLAKQALDRIR